MVPMVPSVVGTLPTRTKPPLRAPSAVLRPGKELVKNVTAAPGNAIGPVGVSFTIVVPRPWMLALLLKLLTRTSPAAIAPPFGNPDGTKATPYGFTSPFSGIVVELTSWGTKAARALATDPSATDRLRLAANMALKRGREDFGFVGASSHLLWVFMVMIFNVTVVFLCDFAGRSRTIAILDPRLRSGFRAAVPISVTGVLRFAPGPPLKSSCDKIFAPPSC